MTKRNLWLAVGAIGAGLLLWLKRDHKRPAAVPSPESSGPRVVVLGAGFAGLTAARKLADRLKGRARITLIDRHNYHLFTPMLYQVAGWGLDAHNVTFPIRQITGAKGIHFRRGLVTGIDFDAQSVQLDNGEVPYDYLVIALGTTTNFFGNEAAEQYAYPLKWLEEGIAIRNRVFDMMEQAILVADPAERQALLTFVVVGGGATGVEAAAALADFLQRVLTTDYQTLDPQESRVILIEMLDRLLPQMNEQVGAIALRELQKIGVEVWLETTAEEMSSEQVLTEDGRSVNSRTVVWATGVRAPDVVANLDVPHGKGGALRVNEYLQVLGRPRVYAVGDNAAIEDAETGEPVPLLAQAATQEGEAVAENVARAIEDRSQLPFHYRHFGNTVTLGRAAGVIEIGEFTINGIVGWLAWRLVHLAKIIGFRDKLVTVLDWITGYLYRLNTARFEMEPSVGKTSRPEETEPQLRQAEPT